MHGLRLPVTINNGTFKLVWWLSATESNKQGPDITLSVTYILSVLRTPVSFSETCKHTHYTILVIASIKLFREVFQISIQKCQTKLCFATLEFSLTRTEQLLAESFVVIGSRHFAALVIHVRIHTIDTEVSLLLGE